jgi:transcriptional regulator with XRE-family HTH domain
VETISRDDSPPGFSERVRQLRISLGLVQSDLAGDGLSSSYLSLLESGKRTPTASVVAALAGKLGTTEQYLLTGEKPKDRERLELSVAYAEIALRNGEARDALSHASQAMESAGTASADLLARARNIRAQALESVGELGLAIREFDELVSQARGEGRFLDALQLTVSLARCHKEAGDLAYALTLAEGGLAEATQYDLVGTDAHAELASVVILLYMLRGDLIRADVLADRVLAQVNSAGSRRARASVYWNASLNAEARDDIDKAFVLADRARALLAEDDDERAIGRFRVAYAWLLLRCSPPRAEQAYEMLVIAHDSLTNCGTEVDLAYCETELGRAKLLLDDPQEALDLARGVLRRLEPDRRHESAHARILLARAHLALGQPDLAVAEYRAAATELTDLKGAERQAAAAWRELADAFTGLHLFEDAAMAYQQALAEAGVRAAPDVQYPTDTRSARRKARATKSPSPKR